MLVVVILIIVIMKISEQAVDRQSVCRRQTE